MAVRDLNLEVGTVTNDSRNTIVAGGGATSNSPDWDAPGNVNDGDDETSAAIDFTYSPGGWTHILDADLGIAYEVESFYWLGGDGGDDHPSVCQYWDGADWQDISGAWSTSGAGRLFTFDTPIAAQRFAAGYVGVNIHIAYDCNTWAINGDDIAGAPETDFVGTPLAGPAPLPVQFTDLSTNTPTSWEWDFGDGGTSTSQNPLHTYTVAGIYTVSMTATNATGSGIATKVDYVVVTEPSTLMDLTQTVCYNNYCFGFSVPDGGGPGQGSYIRRINVSEVEAMGYEDKRALQDGFDAADVFLGRRRIVIDAALYGSTRGAMFDELASLKAAFHPVTAFEADATDLGFLPLDFYRPTADIVTWPTSAYPSGIPLRIYCRPQVPVREEYERQRTGGEDAKGMAIIAVSNLWARDPRVYLQSQQSITLSTSTQTCTYRGDYESWPIVTFTMTAAGSSACQIIVSGGTVQLDLSTITTGSYSIDYMNRALTRVSDNAVFTYLFTTNFTQNFKQVKAGSTARISSLTGMSGGSPPTMTYREAFA